jgi:hypothetical protein
MGRNSTCSSDSFVDCNLQQFAIAKNIKIGNARFDMSVCDGFRARNTEQHVSKREQLRSKNKNYKATKEKQKVQSKEGKKDPTKRKGAHHESSFFILLLPSHPPSALFNCI